MTLTEAAGEARKYRPRFDPTFNYGHLLTALTILAGGVGALTYAADRQARVETKLESLLSARPGIEHSIQQLTSSQLVQDEQLRNLATLAAEARQRLGEVETKLADRQYRR